MLKEYKAHLRENDRINHQFILAMWRSFETGRGFEKKKIAECYRKAVILTIPDAEKVWWEKRPLSVLEMNLLLETQTENLKICEKAIDKLRDAGRTYYLVELLEIEIQILETMPEDAVTEHLEKKRTDRINAKRINVYD